MAVTLHEGTSFVVADDLGDIGPDGDRGYFHLDTRFLSRHELRLDGELPVLLDPAVPEMNEGWHFLTNPELGGAPRATLGIVLHRLLGGGLREEIDIENFGDGDAHVELTLALGSDFAYILTVKKSAASGGAPDWRPRVKRALHGDQLVLDLVGAKVPHRTAITFHPAPSRVERDQVHFRVELARRARWRATVEIAPVLGDARVEPHPPPRDRMAAARRRADVPRGAGIDTDHVVLARAFAQATRDLTALRIKAEAPEGGGDGGGGGDDCAIAAGIPWYMDLFGRDSLISSYEAMLHDPALARGSLDGLARLQGKEVDPVSEEAPGKILHEYRRGPLTPAARKLIPSYPYYGTIDATPLFLVVLSEYVRVTGDLAFARDRWGHVQAAVEWMRRYGDRDGDGFLEYQRDSDLGLVNQGWKDSDDSIRFRDGRIATPSIALVEVQGYAYDARRRVAELARRIGEGAEAERLEEEAAALRRRIAEHYWLAERGFFAEALDGEKHRVDSLTSNPGHLLWSRAVDRDGARAIARGLLGDELFSGFGVRTMGSAEGGYNPVSYHDGSVWPHDNGLILHGLVRYGHHEEASRLAAGLLAALSHFERHRPPELFCGYEAQRYGTPVRYPTACSPQAWASGAVVLIARALVGLEVDALEQTVSLSPVVVPGLSRLELSGVPAGDGHLHVAVRVDHEQARAEVTGLPQGWKRVEPEPPGS